VSVCYRVVGVSKHLLEVADDVSFDGEKVKICLKHGGKYGKFLQLFWRLTQQLESTAAFGLHIRITQLITYILTLIMHNFTLTPVMSI
jgi:hypothetical protein